MGYGGGLAGLVRLVGGIMRGRGGREGETYSSLLVPMKPPRPMEMAPAMSSARPPRTTRRVSPSEERPAVRAKGTVRPSERPRMASEIIRASMLYRRLLLGFSCAGRQLSHC